MAPKRLGPTDPGEWLNRARSNLQRARRTIKGVYLEDLCFDAQQCAEKAIKAVFVHRGLAFPYVHDLAHLLGFLEGNGMKVPKYVKAASFLTGFAVESRYPGLSGPVTTREHPRAVKIAKDVLRWAQLHVTERAPRATRKRRKR